MPTTPATSTATELTVNRRVSAVGTEQRHYMLSPAYAFARGNFDLIAVVPGENTTYVFAANGLGDIADFDPIAALKDTTHHVDALMRLGIEVEFTAETHGSAR